MKMQRLTDVSDYAHYVQHRVYPFEQKKTFFAEGDPVLVTEHINSVGLCIGRDRRGNITVASKRHMRAGEVCSPWAEESWLARLSRWFWGTKREPNYYWRVASEAGVVGILKHWPPTSDDIQIFGYVIPAPAVRITYSVDYKKRFLIERIVINGVTQEYNSFFADWVPLLYQGPFNQETIESLCVSKEQVSGKQLHERDGLVMQHLKRSSRDPLYVMMPNPELSR